MPTQPSQYCQVTAASTFLSPDLQSGICPLRWLSLWEEVSLPQTPVPSTWVLEPALSGTIALQLSPLSVFSLSSYWILIIYISRSAGVFHLETEKDANWPLSPRLLGQASLKSHLHPVYEHQPTPTWCLPHSPLTFSVPLSHFRDMQHTCPPLSPDRFSSLDSP